MPRFFTVKVLGLELPVPRWTALLFGVLVPLAVAVVIYKQVIDEPQLVNLKQANAELAFAVQEYGAHIADNPVSVFTSTDGTLSVRIYPDSCIAVQRKTARGILSRLIPDLDRNRAEVVIPQHDSAWLLIAPLHAQGRCVAQHASQFQSAYGKRSGCWIEVWRRWQDGCEHVQMMNTCSNPPSWDSNQDGSPRVRWTRCVH